MTVDRVPAAVSCGRLAAGANTRRGGEIAMMTLYEAVVAGCVQILRSVNGLINKAEAHCADNALPPESLIGARLAPDMMDFAYQVKSCAVHSIGAIEGLKQGRFSPDMTTPPDSFAALKAKTDDPLANLDGLSPEDAEGRRTKNPQS